MSRRDDIFVFIFALYLVLGGKLSILVVRRDFIPPWLYAGIPYRPYFKNLFLF